VFVFALINVREPLSERRKKMVMKAWEIMDKDKSGELTVADIAHIYDVSQNRDFIEGNKTKDQILEEFLTNFEGVKGNKDGIITLQEFFDYYTDLSMSIPGDDYFVGIFFSDFYPFFLGMMESVWCVTENEEDLVFKERLDTLINTVRHKLQNLCGKSSDEYVLRKIFKDFDLNKNGVLTIDELEAMLARLQISVERKYLTALFRKFDLNQSGTIEFEEFCAYVVHSTYTH
jgi:Ca2+-binding EF-hand superfamily protein